MTDAATRLRTARIRAGYNTVADACDRFGWDNPPARRHHDNGTRPYFNIATALEYARAYKVSPGYLLGLDGDPGYPELPTAEAFSDILETVFQALAPGWTPPPAVLRELGEALADTIAEPDPSSAAGTVARMIARRKGAQAAQ